MCIICTDPNCDHGERCGRVKIYKEGGSASDLLDSRGEWEHVIPGAVIRGSVFLFPAADGLLASFISRNDIAAITAMSSLV